MKNRKYITLIAFATLLFVALFIAEIFTGSVSISIRNIFDVLFNGRTDNVQRTIVMDSRLPRALTSALAGSALALSGLLMQTLFRNALAGPSVLGITSGSSLAVAVLLMAGGGSGLLASSFGASITVALAAVAGAFVVLLIVLFVSQRLNDNASLLIFGVMLAHFTGAVVSILQFKTSPDLLRSFVMWGMGTFSDTNWIEIIVLAFSALTAFVICFFLLIKLNVLLLGDDEAQSLGLNVKKTRLIIILLTGILTGTATAFCGPIAFIGLAVPHIVRFMLKSSNHLVIYPLVLLIGACVGMGCDYVARLAEIPLNAVTSALGAPVVIYIIMKGSKSKAII